MAKRREILSFISEYLQVDAIRDYGPQGLQVEGNEEVT